MTGTAYSSKMKCTFLRWWVLADGEIAVDIPEGTHCDMDGTIEIAQKIMPSVWRIAVFAGKNIDVQYRLFLGKWAAYP